MRARMFVRSVMEEELRWSDLVDEDSFLLIQVIKSLRQKIPGLELVCDARRIHTY
jgi:hypothetical protein